MTITHEKPKLLLVDYENVQQVDLARLDDSFRVIIFVGAGQRSVPFDLVTNAQKLGNRVEWQKVAGEGRNALDFFIACELGRGMERTHKPECVVLSKDKGFDALLKHLTTLGMKSRRITSLHELRHASAPQHEPNTRRVVELLGKLEKKARPRRRKTLAQSISSMFQKKLSGQEVDHIIATLLTDRMISESNGIITYEF